MPLSSAGLNRTGRRRSRTGSSSSWADSTASTSVTAQPQAEQRPDRQVGPRGGEPEEDRPVEEVDAVGDAAEPPQHRASTSTERIDAAADRGHDHQARHDGVAGEPALVEPRRRTGGRVTQSARVTAAPMPPAVTHAHFGMRSTNPAGCESTSARMRAEQQLERPGAGAVVDAGRVLARRVEHPHQRQRASAAARPARRRAPCASPGRRMSAPATTTGKTR